MKSAPAADLRRHRSRQSFGRRPRTGWEGRCIDRERAVGATFSRIETAAAPSPDDFGTFPPVIPFWFRSYRILALFSIAAVHMHPEMVFVSTYSIYRPSLNG